MPKYNVRELWNERYGSAQQIYDYAGRLMLKSACGNHNSNYEPTVDHIRPISQGGKNCSGNLVICHWETNEEKGNAFPHWQANGKRFLAKREKTETVQYRIVENEKKR